MTNRRQFLLAAAAAALATSCRNPSHKIRLALDWKPEPEFGGFYAADYRRHSLDVELLPGGAGTPTIQMVGARSAEFGVTSADQIVVARARGNDVAALYAVYEQSPLGIMVHASRGLKSIGEVFNGGTVALIQGMPFARLLEKKFGFGRVRIVPSPGGDLSAFLRDRNFAQQCFLMSEPLAAKRLGADVQVFPVSDTGFNPYTTVLATSGELLRQDFPMVQAVVSAVREGWQSYLSDSRAVNRKMNSLNPTMLPDVFDQVADAQKPLIETDETRLHGLGSMTTERWEMLIAQLTDLGDIDAAIPAQDCFRKL